MRITAKGRTIKSMKAGNLNSRRPPISWFYLEKKHNLLLKRDMEKRDVDARKRGLEQYRLDEKGSF